MRGWEDVTPEQAKKLSHTSRFKGYKNKIAMNCIKSKQKPLTQAYTSNSNKYGAVKAEINGIKFDSKAEAEYFSKLLLAKKAGEITEIILQPEYTLQEAYTRENGEKVRAIRYRADFLITLADGSQQVIDVKGKKTKEYIIKRKMLLRKYPNINFIEAI